MKEIIKSLRCEFHEILSIYLSTRRDGALLLAAERIATLLAVPNFPYK